MRNLLLATLLCAAAGCGNKILVIPSFLQPGGGKTYQSSEPALDIVVRMHDPAANFNPGDLMRLEVNGVDMADQMVISGFFAILRIDPAPLGTNSITLSRRVGPVFDSATWEVTPYTGPTVNSIAPQSAMEGATVTITGAGFTTGGMRVFLGGVEGTIQSSNSTQITATVPAGALPGPIMVYVGTGATAAGVVQFQPLDGNGDPVPAPVGPLTLVAFSPGRIVPGQVIEVWGYNFSLIEQASANGTWTGPLVGVETITDPLLGDILRGLVVTEAFTTVGAGEFYLLNATANTQSTRYPITVE